MRCNDCRKDKAESDAFLTTWERVKLWAFKHFHEEITDLSAEKYTSGFGEGYAVGFDHAKELARAHTCPVLEPSTQPIPLDYQVDLHKVFEVTKERKMMLGGRILEPNEIAEFQSQAVVLSQIPLWCIMQETLKQKGIEKAVLQSTTWEETLAGKMLIHDVGLRNSILDVLKSYKSQ